MHMIPVVSSNIKSIGYEDNTLYVCFNSGSTYKYLNVPKSVYDALMSAVSFSGISLREKLTNAPRLLPIQCSC